MQVRRTTSNSDGNSNSDDNVIVNDCLDFYRLINIIIIISKLISHHRSRSLLFIAYVLSFASILGSVIIFLHHIHNNKNESSSSEGYVGVANILLTTLITASSMTLWLTRAAAYGSYY